MYKYEKVVYYSPDDDCWVVEIPELPGCIADGKTYEEAINNSEIIIKEWIETAEMLGRVIPHPGGRIAFA